MIAIHRVITGPEPCTYLPNETATMENLIVLKLSAAEYEAKMNAGWRKFGRVLFHPICEHCRACRPIRISPTHFTPSRSQRRALAKNNDFTVRYTAPTFDQQRLDLYNRYHRFRESAKGWDGSDLTEQDYRFQFLQNTLESVEISIWDGETLCAIVLNDITPHIVSGVYHFYDPDYEKKSLGTFAILQTIFLAQLREKDWAYFGFYVAGCGSMVYKAQFRPCELLGVDGVWRSFEPDDQRI